MACKVTVRGQVKRQCLKVAGASVLLLVASVVVGYAELSRRSNIQKHTASATFPGRVLGSKVSCDSQGNTAITGERNQAPGATAGAGLSRGPHSGLISESLGSLLFLASVSSQQLPSERGKVVCSKQHVSLKSKTT
jgi:hypothetical protein